MKSFPSYKYEFGSREDPEWQSYFGFLYPTGAALREILDRQEAERKERNRMVVGEIFRASSDRQIPAQGKAARLSTEAVHCYRPIMAGQTKLGRSSRLNWNRIQGGAAVELVDFRAQRVVPQRGIGNRHVSVVRRMANHANLAAAETRAAEIMSRPGDLRSRRTREADQQAQSGTHR